MFLRINEHLAHIEVGGDRQAQALVLLHSLGTCAQVWDAQAAAFSSRRFVIRPDFRGHGLSEESREPLTIERLAADVMAMLDALEIKEFALAGISIGGLVAQATAARAGQRLTALALFDSTIATPNPEMWTNRARTVRANGLASIAEDVYQRWLPQGALGAVESAGLLQMLRRTSDEGYAAGCDALAGADCRALAGAITATTVVAVGSEDLATPPAAASALAGAIAGARREVIEGAAHIPLFSHADAVNRILETTMF
ncbi:alpha/beta fold hydrolase [Cucumibacter marinus]|uniref:alpha/beta fold hydrolase n=1 Tax=Cucumibacter marinus TaxID=1121252 RepID=UPI00055AC350|nr:alpha/beta fold hydrolase [Cucumibacter marinus]